MQLPTYKSVSLKYYMSFCTSDKLSMLVSSGLVSTNNVKGAKQSSKKRGRRRM
jgi:hypothetical protein